jgi:fumarate reductase subunit C
MSHATPYTEYHPRWHRTRVSTWWWLKRGSYLAFILRELSSVFIAWFILYLLLFVRAVSEGAESYQEFLAWARSPALLVLNAVSLFFVVFHAATWFRLAPQAMVLHLRGKQVPGRYVAAANYGAWALVSALLAWLLLRG